MVRNVAIIVLLLHGLVAVVCGYELMIDPSGAAMQLDIKLLSGTHFVNFFTPGLVLFSALGLGSLAAAFAVIARCHNYERAIMLMGILITGWIVCQILILRTLFFMQYVIAGVGLIVFVCGWILQKHTIKK